MDTHLSHVLVLVVGLGVLAQWLAWRYRVSAIVLLALSGLVAGPLLGWVNPSEDIGELLRPIIGLCVAVILFEGGLSLRFHELKEASAGIKRLCSIGAVFAWVVGTLCAHVIGQLSWPVSLVFGAIIVVTGPTVIIPMLRQAGLNRRTASYLKWEGILNDPVGALLTVLVVQYFVFRGELESAEHVFVTMGWGIMAAMVLGGAGAWFLGQTFKRSWAPDYLKAPLTLALVLVVYTVANMVQHEAGLLATTVMGVVLGNMDLPNMDSMRRFKEYITILLVSSVFVLLTADLQPEVLLHLDWHAGALVLSVLFIVRPMAVFMATAFTDMPWQDRLLVGWIAPRGIVAAAVAGVFGPVMVDAGYQEGELLVPLIFAVIFSTVILHGFTIRHLARWLGLASDPHGVLIVGASPWSTELARSLHKDLGVEVLLVDSSWHRLRDARLAGIKVLYGEVLSENVQHSLELNEIGCVLTATSNDAYNSLVCTQFSQELERDQVYQLPMYSDDNGGAKGLARPLVGVAAIGDNAQYEELWRCHFQSWKFFKTRITDSYVYEDFQRDCPTGAMIIGTFHEDGRFEFYSHLSPRPRSGDTVVYYSKSKLMSKDGGRPSHKPVDVVDENQSEVPNG